MLLRKDIEANGFLVADYFYKRNVTGAGMVEVRFPTFPGTAQLYVVIVSTSKETSPHFENSSQSKTTEAKDYFNDPIKEVSYYSVYIATVSAGCQLDIWTPPEYSNLKEKTEVRGYKKDELAKTTGCATLYYTETSILVTFSLAMGIVIALFAHKLFSLAQFVYGMLIVGLLVYPLVSAYLHLFWI